MEKLFLLVCLMLFSVGLNAQIQHKNYNCKNLQKRYKNYRMAYFNGSDANWGQKFITFLKKDRHNIIKCKPNTEEGPSAKEEIDALRNNIKIIIPYLKQNNLNWISLRDDKVRETIKNPVMINIWLLEENLWYLYSN